MKPNLLVVGSLLGSSLLVAGGCTSRSADSGFDDVQKAVARRQPQTIRWNRGSGEDQEAARLVQDLLAKELSVAAAVQIALLNNRSLQAVYEDLGIAQADLVRAGLPRNPVFDAEARFQRGGGLNLEMSLVADFLDLFFIPMRKRLAGSAFAAAKLRVSAAVIDLAGDTRRAFYHAQAVQQMLDLRRTVFKASEASWELARRLHEAGNRTDLDVATERGFFEEARLELASAEAELSEAREQLNRLLGVWGNDTAWKLPERLPDLPSEEQPLDQIERQAIERSLRLAAAKQEITGAAERLGVARPFAAFDETGLGVSAERDSDGAWAAGPAVSIPLPLFNRGGPARSSAAAALRRTQARYYAEAVDIRAQARMARNRLITARARVDYLFHVILPLRQTIVDRTLEHYNAMQVSPFQLIDAKQQQIETGVRYVQALADYWSAHADLRGILDGGSAAEAMRTGADPSTESGPSSSAGGHP